MLNWLFDTYELLGAGILIYAVTLVITHRGQRIF
jgi:hypothetical protein